MEHTGRTFSSGFVASLAAVCCAVFFVIAQTASPTSSAPSVELAPVELRALASQATLRVAANSCGRVTRGSGVIIDGHLVTNAHIVTGASELKADQPIDPVVVDVTASDLGRDLASARPPRGVSLLLAADETVASDRVVGLEVSLAGHADGGGIEIQNGMVSARVPGGAYGYTTDVLLINAATRGGYSGGPVLDRSGAVVAILSGFDRATGLTLAVPADVVRDFLDQPADRTGPTGALTDCGTR